MQNRHYSTPLSDSASGRGLGKQWNPRNRNAGLHQALEIAHTSYGNSHFLLQSALSSSDRLPRPYLVPRPDPATFGSGKNLGSFLPDQETGSVKETFPRLPSCASICYLTPCYVAIRPSYHLINKWSDPRQFSQACHIWRGTQSWTHARIELLAARKASVITTPATTRTKAAQAKPCMGPRANSFSSQATETIGAILEQGAGTTFEDAVQDIPMPGTDVWVNSKAIPGVSHE